MYFFGYVQNDQDPENNTPFFSFDEHKEEDLHNYKGFIKHNEQVLSQLG